jgi:alpha-aminoadipate carrier protein LysW
MSQPEHTSTAVASGACPECDAKVSFSRRPLRAEVVICNGCAAELEVVACEPLKLELAPEVEEDWGE